jgi:hypothetical protein
MNEATFNQAQQDGKIVLQPLETATITPLERTLADLQRKQSGFTPQLEELRAGTILGKAYLSASVSLSGGPNKVPFDRVEMYGRLGFDAANHRFQVNFPGVYVLHAQVDLPNPVSGGGSWIEIRQNNISIAHAELSCGVSNKNLTLQTTTMKRLVGGDYIEVFLLHQFGATTSINFTPAYTFLTLTKIK